MQLKRQAKIILAFVKALYINGQTTTIVINEGVKLGQLLHLEVEIMLRWGEIIIEIKDEKQNIQTNLMSLAQPTNVDMRRVMGIMNLLKEVHENKISLQQAYDELPILAHLPPATTKLFTFANGIGAVALGVIFGLHHWLAAFIIFISASLGGFARRLLSKTSSNLFVQPFCAALIAGLIGALAKNQSSTLHLIAVCPCMVLIPGPHFLNGFLDFMHARIHLGICRLVYANLQVLAIISGLLIGLHLLGGSLPVTPNSSHITPLVWDSIAAGFAVIAYNIFFSMPWKMVLWPVVVGMLAHTIRWEAMINGNITLISATFISCFFVGLILNWISNRQYVPFAGGGFSAVVSMIPGVYLFRMGSGFIQLSHPDQVSFPLLSHTLYQGIIATGILLAIAFGLLVPKLLLDRYFFQNSK